MNLEDAIFQNHSADLESLELPLPRATFILFFVVTLFFGILFAGRLFLLSSGKGELYKARAAMNAGKPFNIPAIRGVIYDRFGKPLVQNEPAFRVDLNIASAKRQNADFSKVFLSLSEILGKEKTEFDSLLEKADLEKAASIVVARDPSPEQIIAIRGLGADFLEIQDDYRRQYLKGSSFAHILGYTGLAEFNDVRGKTGLEAYYDEFLRGEDGVRLVYRDAFGKPLEEKLLIESKTGGHLYTTIDSGLQEYFYRRLSEALRVLGRQAGVGIALNPQNGEILALVSLPGYDGNIFTRSGNSKSRQALLLDPSLPLFNRAISGVYAPGSTIKPLVAAAALNEKIINPEKQIFSAGFIEIPNPYFPDQPSRFLDWKPHGWVDLRAALARSSNVYFYAVGGGVGDVKGLGIEKLKEYWQKFGLGFKTGIDLDSESIGFLPDPQEKMKRSNDIWRLGDTYNAAIGQGDVLATPLQLVNYIGAIANGGKFYKPHIVASTRHFVAPQEWSESGLDEIVEIRPEIIRDVSSLKEAIKEVQEGMNDAVSKPYGTASLLGNLPISVAAKTGSAQVANNTQTNAFFVAYAPADNPQIAILVLIENAREGSLNAVPVGKDVLDWYYWRRLTK